MARLDYRATGQDATFVTRAFAEGVADYAARALREVRHLVVHRIAVSVEDASYADTPGDVIRFFREHPIGIEASGGKMPYCVLIDRTGAITQTVPLGRVTPHARRHNPSAIGVACVGDFRVERPSRGQKRALVQVCAHILSECRLDATALVGHDELPDARRDPNKECPGRHLDVAKLRDIVTAALSMTRRRIALVW